MANAHERFMQIAMEEARRGAAEGNAAVGSVVVHDENMVARGRNLVATQSDPTAHAETVALRNAGAAMGHTDFSGFTLYTTFEPCPLCYRYALDGVAAILEGSGPTPATSSSSTRGARPRPRHRRTAALRRIGSISWPPHHPPLRGSRSPNRRGRDR